MTTADCLDRMDALSAHRVAEPMRIALRSPLQRVMTRIDVSAARPDAPALLYADLVETLGDTPERLAHLRTALAHLSRLVRAQGVDDPDQMVTAYATHLTRPTSRMADPEGALRTFLDALDVVTAWAGTYE